MNVLTSAIMARHGASRRAAPGVVLAAAVAMMALGACSGGSSADAGGEITEPAPVAYTPPGPRLRRLTRSQYDNTVRDLFGEALVLPRSLEPDLVRDGSMAVGAANSSISPRGVEQFLTAGYDIAQQLLREPARRTTMLACTPTGVDDPACAEQFIRAVGRRLWRRPLQDAEVARLRAIASTSATTLNDFHRGLEFALGALLAAPDFLFRAELGEVDPTTPPVRRYAAYEFASRLSFFLWDSGPDDALLDAAASGALDTPEGLTLQVERLLASPRSRRGLRAFLTDWWMLWRLDNLTKDTQVFPTFAPDLGPAAREEVLRLGEHLVFDRDADFRDVITTRDTFVNRRLAAVYNIPFPVRDATPTQFTLVTLPDNGPRRGYFGTAAFLAAYAHPTSTSPTLRGRYLRETILCGTIPDPPVDLNTGIPEASESARTFRQRVRQHLSSPACSGCHSLMDPQGLGFEAFDGIGRFRRTDNGEAIDSSGTWESVPFVDAIGLSEQIRLDSRLPQCLVTRLFRFAHGHIEQDSERAEVGRLQEWFAWQGYRVRPLLREIATSRAFRRTAAVGEGGMK